MFEWIKFIGEFLAGMFHGIVDLLTLFGDGIATISVSTDLAPFFLKPIIGLMVSVVIIMWVVNLF